MKLDVSLRFSPDNVIPVGRLADRGRDTFFEFAADFVARGLNPAP